MDNMALISVEIKSFIINEGSRQVGGLDSRGKASKLPVPE
jgi:hypothetical protein